MTVLVPYLLLKCLHMTVLVGYSLLKCLYVTVHGFTNALFITLLYANVMYICIQMYHINNYYYLCEFFDKYIIL